MRKLQIIDICDCCNKESKVYKQEEILDIFNPPPGDITCQMMRNIHICWSTGGASYPYLCPTCSGESKKYYDEEYIKLKNKTDKEGKK